MEPVKFHLDNVKKTYIKEGFLNKIKHDLLFNTFKNTYSRLLLILSAIIIASLLAFTGISGGVLFVLAVVSLPLLYIIIAYPGFGIIFLLLMAYLLFAIMKFNISFPLGTLIDGLEVLLVIGLLFRIKGEKNRAIFKEPIGLMLLIWIGYNLLEVANPEAESTLAWLYTVRTVAIISLTYFVFLYNIRTVQFLRLILKIWIVLSFLGAAYALKQQFIGFSASEEAWLHSDPDIENLLFINGQWRIFSFFSDPVAFSYNMIVSSILCITLITGPFKSWKKIVLGALAAFFLFAMVYSGTRSAYVLLPAALGLLAILKFNKRVLVFTLVAAFLLAILVVIPTSNVTLYRFQSAFKPSNDASYNLRKANQKKIQPYILTHPMGGGLGATGVWGSRFAPHSYLANFPPDSGYVRVAAELGWIGLFLFCLLMFTILRRGINNFYKINDPELKTYCLSMVLIVFAFNIGNYPQEALVQLPSNIYFYLVAAILNVTLLLDQKPEIKKKLFKSQTFANQING